MSNIICRHEVDIRGNDKIVVIEEHFNSNREAKRSLLNRGYLYCHSLTVEQYDYDGIRPRVFLNATTGHKIFLASEEDWSYMDDYFYLDELVE